MTKPSRPVTWVRIVGRGFVCGLRLSDADPPRVIECAPYLKRALLGKTQDHARTLCQARGWAWEPMTTIVPNLTQD